MSTNIKMVCLFKRKLGTTKEQFKNYYEANHAPLAMKLTGQYVKKYSRSYIMEGEQALIYKLPANATVPYDVVTEVQFDSEENFEKFTAASFANKETFEQDELNFMDQPARVIWIVREQVSPPHTSAD